MSLFERYYGASKKCLKKIMKPFNKKKLRRMAEAYYDSCIENQIKLAEKSIKSIVNIDEWSGEEFEKIVKTRIDLDTWQTQAEKCREIYKEIFGEELPVDEINIEDLMPELGEDE